MISEQDKQAILNGEHGVTRCGHKATYLGKSNNVAYPYWIAILDDNDLIHRVGSFNENLQEYDDYGTAIVGLWKNYKIKPFNLEEALQGKPVRLRNGYTAYVEFALNYPRKAHYALNGYCLHPDNTQSSCAWTIQGNFISEDHKDDYDIIGMWDY